MTHADLSQNDELPSRNDHNAPRPEPSRAPAEHVAAAQQAPAAAAQQATAQQATGQQATGQQATAQRAPGRSAPDGRPVRTQLLAPEELQGITARWRDIQAGFVDEPHRAVMDADALVADLMQHLARMFEAEREELQARWVTGHDTSTEDLRQGLRRYRSFFERLLAV